MAQDKYLTLFIRINGLDKKFREEYSKTIAFNTFIISCQLENIKKYMYVKLRKIQKSIYK